MAIADADGIGFVIDMVAVVAFEIGFIEQSPRCHRRCARICHCGRTMGQVRAFFTVGVHQ